MHFFKAHFFRRHRRSFHAAIRRNPIIADLVIGAAEEAEGQSRRGEETGDEARREEIALDASAFGGPAVGHSGDEDDVQRHAIILQDPQQQITQEEQEGTQAGEPTEPETSVFHRGSTFPLGFESSPAEEFFADLFKPRKYLTDVHVQAIMNWYRLRLIQKPNQFASERIAILDPFFSESWICMHPQWLNDNSILPGGAYDYFHGFSPLYAATSKAWGRDVDTLYVLVHMKKEEHWVALVISIDQRTVTVYDSMDVEHKRLREVATPFAQMVPYIFSVFSDANSCDLTMFEIIIAQNLPKHVHPHGDCGVYALKYVECLMMGVPIDAKHLNDGNMARIRRKLGIEMFVETKLYGESMNEDERIAGHMEANVAFA